MEDFDSFIKDTMTWSFSRINAASSNGCMREWKKHYIDLDDTVNSAYGQSGSVAHSVLESYFKGELNEFELSDAFTERYSEEVTMPFPEKTGDTVYDKALEYFENFSFESDKYNILGVEKKIEFNIGEYKCVGYIDLLLRDKEDGRIIVLDHKSSSIKILKNGNVSKGDAEHFLAFKRQLYLYSKAVIEEYNEEPKTLKWNMFKDHTYIEIPWDRNEYEEALVWAEETIKTINKETNYPANPSYFYCCHLCSVRDQYCPYKRLGMIFDSMYSKCYSSKNPDYFSFGGAGITICDKWKDDKNKFFEWALENGYADDLVLRRFNYDDGYYPENCFWTTKEETEWGE